MITRRGPPCTLQKTLQVAVIFWSQQMNRELSAQFAPLEHCLDAQIVSRESINHEGSDESNFVQAGSMTNDDIWYVFMHGGLYLCVCVHMSIVCITPVALNNLCPTPQRTSAA